MFSVSGPDPILKGKILPALGLNFLEDKELTYYLYAEMEKHDGIYQYDAFDSPNTRRSWPSFNLFGLDVPERLFNRYHFESNFKFRPKQNLKFVFSYKKWVTRRTLFDWNYRYSAATAPVRHDNEHTISLELSHAVSKDMNYEVILSVHDLDITQKPGDPNNPGRGLDPDQILLQSDWEDWDDVNLNGVYDPPEPIINLFPDTATYGSDYSGPGYTHGEYYDRDHNGIFEWDPDGNGIIEPHEDLPLFLFNYQGMESYFPNFRFNDNGVFDNLEGEPFIDLNGNGVWDAGEFLYDKNGNGLLDNHRLCPVGERTPEPFIDGDSVLGEPFIDLNANGWYEVGIDLFVITDDPLTNQDLNYNGKYDGPWDQWTPGIPFYDRNGNGFYDRPNHSYDLGEPYTDVNGNGRYDGGGTTFLDPFQHNEGIIWHHRFVRTMRGEVKVYRQMGRHELKAGFAIARDEATFEEIERQYVTYSGPADDGAYPDRGAFRDFYHYDPWNGTFYARDKLEYGSMIASLGIRWDFFLQDVGDLADMLERDDRGGLIKGDRHKFSPRIGFSYPISDKAKVYFNYGHFFQLPQLRYMYARNTKSTDQNDVVGNPNLDYMKTIQYSFGVKYAMSESYSVDIQGYFKDEFDKINAKTVKEGSMYREAYRNCDYGRSRGFELTLEKRGGGYVNGQVSYTYAFAFGKASQTNEDYLGDFYNLQEPLSEAALSNDIRHSLKTGIQIYMPTTVKPRLFGLPIPNGWSLSLESIVESGAPFTPDPRYPDISQTGTEDIEKNSMRYPATAVFDVRFAKEVELLGIDWDFICWVENIFDSRNVVSIYTSTGRADTNQNLGTYRLIYGGTEYQKNPYNWDYGRQIRFGLEMSL